MQRLWKKPELMSPAGYWPQLKTAIEAGANAVYFGLKHFTARAKVGFGLAELPEVMRTLHATAGCRSARWCGCFPRGYTSNWRIPSSVATAWYSMPRRGAALMSLKRGAVSTRYNRSAETSCCCNSDAVRCILRAFGSVTWYGAALTRRCPGASSTSPTRRARSTRGRCLLRLRARAGEPLQLVAQTADGYSARATGTVRLAPAQPRALDEAFCREHLGKLGGTPFHLETVTLESAAPLFVPVSEVNALRRHVVEQLMALRTSHETQPTSRVVTDALAQLTPPVAHHTPVQVHVLVRPPEQLEAALAVRPASITLDYNRVPQLL